MAKLAQKHYAARIAERGIKLCAAPGCRELAYRLGAYCSEHQTRVKRTGTYLAGPSRTVKAATVNQYAKLTGRTIRLNRKHPAIHAAIAYLQEVLRDFVARVELNGDSSKLAVLLHGIIRGRNTFAVAEEVLAVASAYQLILADKVFVPVDRRHEVAQHTKALYTLWQPREAGKRPVLLTRVQEAAYQLLTIYLSPVLTAIVKRTQEALDKRAGTQLREIAKAAPPLQ